MADIFLTFDGAGNTDGFDVSAWEQGSLNGRTCLRTQTIGSGTPWAELDFEIEAGMSSTLSFLMYYITNDDPLASQLDVWIDDVKISSLGFGTTRNWYEVSIGLSATAGPHTLKFTVDRNTYNSGYVGIDSLTLTNAYIAGITNETASGGATTGGEALVQSGNVDTAFISGGATSGGEAIVTMDYGFTSDGGVTFGENHYWFYPPTTCDIVTSVIECDCTNESSSDTTASGLTLGSATWSVVIGSSTSSSGGTAGDIQAHYPLARVQNMEIAFDLDVTAHGEMDITTGLLCDYAEKFNINRYYNITMPTHTDGLTVTLWYRYRSNINEQTFFSLDPALRFGLTWLAEPVLSINWFDGTTTDIYGEALTDTDWHHLAFSFSPNNEITLVTDGELVASASAKDIFATADTARIGNLDGGGYIIGDMQDLRIYIGSRTVDWLNAEKESICNTWITH